MIVDMIDLGIQRPEFISEQCPQKILQSNILKYPHLTNFV